jgi:hypothetical protein
MANLSRRPFYTRGKRLPDPLNRRLGGLDVSEHRKDLTHGGIPAAARRLDIITTLLPLSDDDNDDDDDNVADDDDDDDNDDDDLRTVENLVLASCKGAVYGLS